MAPRIQRPGRRQTRDGVLEISDADAGGVMAVELGHVGLVNVDGFVEVCHKNIKRCCNWVGGGVDDGFNNAFLVLLCRLVLCLGDKLLEFCHEFMQDGLHGVLILCVHRLIQMFLQLLNEFFRGRSPQFTLRPCLNN